MCPISIFPYKIQDNSIYQGFLNTYQDKHRVKVTQKLMLLSQRDNRTPKEIIPKFGALESHGPTDTRRGPKDRSRNAP